MRPIKAREQLAIPDDGTINKSSLINLWNSFFFVLLVKVSVKSRVVQVTGKRGKLVRSFRHSRVDISMPKKNLIVVEKWFGTNKENAVVRTICSHINNMVKGVTKVNISKLFFILYFCLFYSRVIVIKCVQSMLTFPSTPLLQIMVNQLKFVIS